MTNAGEPIEKSLFEAPPIAEQERMVEAILFASTEPVTVAELTSRMPHGCDAAEALAYLRKRYEGRGVRLMHVGDAWAFRTAPDLGHLMQRNWLRRGSCRARRSRPWRLSPITSPPPAPR